MLNPNDKVVYKPGSVNLYAILSFDGKQSFSGQELEYILRDSKGGLIMSYAEAEKNMEKAQREQFDRPAIPCTEERYDDMLNCLPPMKWVNNGVTESFMVSERIISNYVMIFARIGNQYFEMSGLASMSHKEIIERCKA